MSTGSRRCGNRPHWLFRPLFRFQGALDRGSLALRQPELDALVVTTSCLVGTANRHLRDCVRITEVTGDFTALLGLSGEEGRFRNGALPYPSA